MASKIKLVKDDTGPPIIASITDKNTVTQANPFGAPIDLTGATVVMFFREIGSTTIKSTLTGTLLTGRVLADGITVDTAAPYNVAGAGGRVSFAFGATTLDTAGEFEGEIQITKADATIQTVYDKYKFTVRADF